MFSTRRLAKRSIIGTRVSSPWTDGRYYPGQIQSTQTWPNGEEVYTVAFDEGFSKVFREKEIIGPGFQPITSVILHPGQKVYVTHHGREVKGVVRRHSRDDEVTIELTDDSEGWDDSLSSVRRRLEDVRLLESRRSARLQDQSSQNYSKLIDPFSGDNPNKKRVVSHTIQVPAPKARRRKLSRSPSPESESSSWRMEKERIMDEHAAAMVLTSLSCSPLSPVFPHNPLSTESTPGQTSGAGSSPGGVSSGTGSSGVWGMKSEPGTPSPPTFQLSHSAPSAPIFGSPLDEGIEMDETAAYFEDERVPRKKRMSTRTVFKCTWPGCDKIYNTCEAIEHHVRMEHLHEKYEQQGSDSEEEDHEEEFYYTEVEVTVDTVTQTFADMNTSSPPQHTGPSFPPEQDPLRGMPMMVNMLPDHDYQKKSTSQSVPYLPSTRPLQENCNSPLITPVSGSSQSPHPFSWQPLQTSEGGPKNTKSAERLHVGHTSNKSNHTLSSSPKNSPMHKKTRSEVKKCRKVYGMENRDMWCTQCKWKKACTRFLD